MLIVLTLACFQSDFLSRPLPEGIDEYDVPSPEDTGASTRDTVDTGEATEEGGDDTEPPEDTGGGKDTGPEPTPSGYQVCYPGADESWTTCVDVVEWSSAWGSDYDYPDPYNGSSQYLAPVRFIDLSAVDPGLSLSPNFTLEEFMQEWKGRYAVYQPHAIERMQELRDAVGGALYVNSGYRNVAYNAGVGGATYSRHMYGDACDFYSTSASLGDLEDICGDLDAGYIGLYTSHIHCDWRNDSLETAFYDAAFAYIPPPDPIHAASLIPGVVWTAPAIGFDEGEPLRQWWALDEYGAVLEEWVGTWYTPPEDAAFVEVRIGGQMTLREAMPGSR